MKTFVMSLTVLILSIGCAKDPSEGVPKAKVVAPPPQKKVADKAAPKPTSKTTVPSVNVKLSGNLRFTGSKVTGSHFCDMKDTRGTLTMTGDDLATGVLKFEAQTAKIHCDAGERNDWTGKLESHLKDSDFLWVEKHPKASFVSTAIAAKASGKNTHQITGNLNLRGVTKSISFGAAIVMDAKQVSGTTEFAINRKDFGIEYAGKADNLIRDSVVLNISLKGTR